ncbi:hypothetical protein [Deinococcus pimensis]|uniref:hypothetical protein n=1 Tax=Deinococcus pimensis TaxID=309888 RepID=UPI000489910E|nr:hypothetical protein [Deinococcus pimensis]
MARGYLSESLTLLRRLGKFTRLPNVLLELSELELETGRPDRAAVLLGAVAGTARHVGVPLAEGLRQLEADVRARVSERVADVTGLTAGGETLDPAEAVAFALDAASPPPRRAGSTFSARP